MQIAQRIVEALRQVPGLTSLGAIGSVAMGTAGAVSDLDMVGTYGPGFHLSAFEAACDSIGRDPDAVAHSADPETLIAALRVEGVSVSVILGPESHLLDTARRVLQAPREDYDLKFASYGHAAVLYDPKNLWPGVKAAIQVAQKKLAMGTEI
ncbi:MAG: hypothetical protein FJ279_34115 [Planctomycetes bacterium]|nr:hypothetical protein [Planctomycetota bacterium]